MSEIKIFKMNECEWMAAASAEDAVSGYAETVLGYDHPNAIEAVKRDEMIDEDCPRELSGEEMDRCKFHDEDDEGYGKPGYEPRSFRQELEREIAMGRPFPAYFACTEF